MACPWWDDDYKRVGGSRHVDQKGKFQKENNGKNQEEYKGRNHKEYEGQYKPTNHNGKMKDQKQPDKSYERGYHKGHEKGYERGYENGYENGYQNGYVHGYLNCKSNEYCNGQDSSKSAHSYYGCDDHFSKKNEYDDSPEYEDDHMVGYNHSNYSCYAYGYGHGGWSDSD